MKVKEKESFKTSRQMEQVIDIQMLPKTLIDYVSVAKNLYYEDQS